ncbi:divalent-cation tolerance protein CutA [Hephaestia sp. GCM10023244]|uniref:divalent-cation tolerance protein CutA n=1 Tax=unclassified Hephaestia TaxID=2631281 RepID=UPI0020779151|nr:divalent-cation tolerance protein CutA [Hephaestia sp. MAHUQ-44]MCM8731949.1 divalent-cation tolerance protein CutA [Hephaestia sp. MAHUQ-44]
MTDIALVRVTFGGADEADRIARLMIDQRIAACVTIDRPCTAIFRWNGAVDTAEEVTATFTTTIALAAMLATRIAALHSYDLPVIERWPVAVDDAVAQWIDDATHA